MTLMSCLLDSRGKQLVIGGHRGHQSNVRENTVSNFKQLAGKKIPYIEIDVQLTQDNQVVIFHDTRLETSTDLHGTIYDYSLNQLREQFEINTAEDAIAWCSQNQMGIAFELKTHILDDKQNCKTVAEKLVAVIQQYSFHQDCFVFGKDYETLSYIKRIDSRINIGVIAPQALDDALLLLKDLQGFLYLDYLSGLSEPLISQLHEAGYLVDGSVINTEEELKEALRLGVDMIESDYPERIIKILSLN